MTASPSTADRETVRGIAAAIKATCIQRRNRTPGAANRA